MNFQYDDGGRKAAGFKGDTGDCVVRSIAIVTGKPYKEVYNDIFSLGGKSPRLGVAKKVYHKYLLSQGFEWIPTMFVGQGCKVHLCKEELPEGKLIVRLSKHITAVVDGAVHDTYDPSRNGLRCVYGYYRKESIMNEDQYTFEFIRDEDDKSVIGGTGSTQQEDTMLDLLYDAMKHLSLAQIALRHCLKLDVAPFFTEQAEMILDEKGYDEKAEAIIELVRTIQD
jgi:hypothetical protein